MGGVFIYPQGLVEATLGVEVLQTGQLTPCDVSGSANNPPHRPAVLVNTAAIPGCGAAWQEALYCPSAKFPDGVWPQAKLIQVPETIQALLGLFNHCRDMATPSQVLLNVHPKL